MSSSRGGAMELWEEVAELLLDAIVKYTPKVEKDLPKKSEQFARRKKWIVYDHTFTRVELFHEDVCRSTTACIGG